MVEKRSPQESPEAFDRLANFLKYPVALKCVKRAGWISKVRVRDPESVADHSYCMCVAGMVLADLQGLDTAAAMRMILLHDLSESVTGDYMPGEVDRQEKTSAENKAMADILSFLPAEIQQKYAALWREYVDGKTRLARFVHRMDKFEMWLQAREYARQGYPSASLKEFFISAEEAVTADASSDDATVQILRSLSPAKE